MLTRALNLKAAMRALFAFALLALQVPIFAQPGFQNAIGMEKFEKGSSIRVLPDGGFIIAGETESYELVERDMLLMRTDSAGNISWIKTFGSPDREVVNDVMHTSDAGILFTAEKYQPKRTEGEHLTLIKTDRSGIIQWKKIYDEGGNETEGFSMTATPDKGYVVTGMVKSLSTISSSFFNMNAEEQNLYLIKIDESGNKTWSRQFFYGDKKVSSTGTSVITTRDGSLVLTGNVARQGKTDKKIDKPALEVNESDMRNMLLAKVNQAGKLVWAQEFKVNGFSMGYTVIETKDGGLLAVGNTLTTTGNVDIFVLSMNADGTVKWAKSFGGSKFESVADVVQAPDGGFVVSGMTFSYGAGASDILHVKLDANGNLQWAKTYGGKSEDMPSRLAVTKTGLVLVGSTASQGSESFDVLLLKTDWNGNGNCFSAPVNLQLANVAATSAKLPAAAMNPVDEGIPAPNMKKPDAAGIREVTRKMRSKNLCK